MSNPTRMNRLIELLIGRRHLLLAVAAVATAIAIPVAGRLEFDQSIESLYASDDPVLSDFQNSRAWFGGDEFVIVAFELSPLFQEDGLELTDSAIGMIERLGTALSEIPGVNPKSTQDLVRSLRFPYRRARVIELLEGILVGNDRGTTALVLRLLPESESAVSRAETIRRIRAVTDGQNFPVFVVGEPVQIHDMFRYVEEDGRQLFLTSVVLLAMVLFAFFRNIRWVLASVLVVLLTIVWTQSVLVLSGARLSMSVR